MTVREMETLAGMTRANIRYYEQEGLFSPMRGANGYRDYSEEDLGTLRRIKLLRSLYIPLEEIRKLQTGESELTDTLAQKIRELERVQRDAASAQDVCRAMREDRATYLTLDAQKYLDFIPRQTAEYRIAADSAPQVFYPWRRFLARMLDMLLYQTAWSVMLALGFNVNLSGRSGLLDFLDNVCALIIMLFLEPLLLRLFGTTFGKRIFGLRLEDENGLRPSYAAGFSRTGGVIVYGLGCYIPIYSLVRLWKSYKLCAENGPQPWDFELVYAIRDRKWYRGVSFAAAVCAVLGLFALTITAAQLPRNRGEVTVSEFAENYNQLAEYYGIKGNRYLDSDGKWAEEPDSGQVYITIGELTVPDFEYAVEDGVITDVQFAVSVEGGGDMLGSVGSTMTLAALSFAGAQREAGLFSDVRQEIAETISAHSFESFALTKAGVLIECRVDYSGYDNFAAGQGILIPEEEAERRFQMEFSMEKQAG